MEKLIYPGSKNGNGICSWLINNIPPHERYFELYAGSAALYYAKKGCNFNLLTDVNQKIINYHSGRNLNQKANIIKTDALSFIDGFVFTEADFIYLDPPYPKSARRSGRTYYENEMLNDDEHEQLLKKITSITAMVMISTRQNDLYDQMLHNWRKEIFQTADRAGVVYEVIYMNYPVPEVLHQYDYVGRNFTDRQRIKRKITSLVNNKSRKYQIL